MKNDNRVLVLVIAFVVLAAFSIWQNGRAQQPTPPADLTPSSAPTRPNYAWPTNTPWPVGKPTYTPVAQAPTQWYPATPTNTLVPVLTPRPYPAPTDYVPQPPPYPGPAARVAPADKPVSQEILEWCWNLLSVFGIK